MHAGDEPRVNPIKQVRLMLRWSNFVALATLHPLLANSHPIQAAAPRLPPSIHVLHGFPQNYAWGRPAADSEVAKVRLQKVQPEPQPWPRDV